MSEVARIDWPNRHIIGASGTKYVIAPERLSSARYVEFELRAMTQGFKTNLDGIIKLLDSVEVQLTKGELNPIGNAHEALVLIGDFRKNLVDVAQYKRTESIEFCALFCNAEGEDVKIFDEELIKSKWEDWKGIPNEDFFLLSTNVKILLSNRYRDILQEAQKQLLPV